MKPTGWSPGRSSRRAARRSTRRRSRCRRTRRRSATRGRACARRARRASASASGSCVIGQLRSARRSSNQPCRMSCAATWSRARAPVAAGRPPASSADCAILRRLALVDQRDRQCEAAGELPRERRARCVIACSRAIRMHRHADDQRPRLPLARSARRSRRSAASSRVARRSWSADARPRERIAHRDADAPRAEIEREHRRVGGSWRSRVTRARRPRTAARSRCRAAASPPAAAAPAARRTARSASAATVSHAFCASSCSSWPAAQPA